MSKRITYKELSDVLESLGYERTDVKGDQRIFDHKSVDSLIVLPYRPMNEQVDPARLAAVKTMLVAGGIVNGNVDELLAKPVAG